MNAMNDTKTLEMVKSAKETGSICDRLWHLSMRGQNVNFQMAKLALKTTQMLRKNKACHNITYRDLRILPVNVSSGRDWRSVAELRVSDAVLVGVHSLPGRVL